MTELLNNMDFGAEPLSVTWLLLSLGIGLALSLFTGWHYVKYGGTFANREELSRVLPMVCLATVLIITIVKTSLALSLGLVGALSIVRFRTPIKEAEELAYLFLTIAIGVGLGASQFVATVVGTLFILLTILIVRLRKKSNRGKTVNLWISFKNENEKDPGIFLSETIRVLSEHLESVDLSSFDCKNDQLEAAFRVQGFDAEALQRLIKELTTKIPGVEISLLDESKISGL
jgi:uncharacterized membrane protein YhiD involved in acid resistance